MPPYEITVAIDLSLIDQIYATGDRTPPAMRSILLLTRTKIAVWASRAELAPVLFPDAP